MDTPPAPDEVFAFWEDMYRAREGVWSGHVNAAVADVAGALPPGRAIDLGAGEGGDALWLAERGWTVTGVDVSPTALARAQATAERAGLSERITWVAADLHTWRPAERVDLVTAAFFQSPVALERATILRVARGWVAPGGHLLVVSHAARPPWAVDDDHGHDGGGPEDFPTPEEELVGLGLPEVGWEVAIAEIRDRSAYAPDGTEAELSDTVVLVRRTS